MDDKKKILYDGLSKDYDLGSFEDFNEAIKDSTTRRRVYEAASERYSNMGDFDSFSEKLGFGTKPQEQQKPAEQPVEQSVEQPATPETQPQAAAPAQARPRRTFNVSPNPAVQQAAQEAMTPEPAAGPQPQAEQAPARDFGVQNYYQEGKQQAANRPKPSLETEKTTMERNLDAINQSIAEQNFPEIQDGNGNSYKVMAAAAVDADGTLHIVAKDKDGKDVELTAKDYADFMPDNSVEGRNKRQMEADRKEIERLNAQIEARQGDKANRKDEDFVGPVLDKKASKEARKDLEAEKARALYRLDNNPEYQKAIAREREQYTRQMEELDEALAQSGGGTGGRTVEEVVGDFNPQMAEGDAERLRNEQIYGAAARMLQDADEIMATGLRYADEDTGVRARLKSGQSIAKSVAGGIYDEVTGEFSKAAVKDMANPDFWTMGMTDVIDNVTFRNIMERAEAQALAESNGEEVKDPLSPVEEKLVEAYLTRANAMMIRSEDQSQGSKQGKGAAESLKFMIDMALSGGLGRALTATAVKQGGKTVMKGAAEAFVDKYVAKLGRKLAGMGADTAFKAAGKAAFKEGAGLGIKLAGDVIETIPKVAVSPLTAQSIAEQAAQYDPINGFQSWGKSFAKGVPFAAIEKFSELHGGIYQRAAKNLFKASGANALYNTLVSKDLRKTFSDWAKKSATGTIGKAFAAGEWDGLFEMAEEMENAALYEMMGEKGSWSDFWTRDNWLEMLGSFAPMTVFGMAANAGENIYANRKFEKSLGVLGEMGFNTEALRDVARTSTVKDLAAYLAEGLGSVQNGALVGTVEGIQLGAEDKVKAAKAVSDFMKSAVRLQALDGVYQGQQQQRMEDKQAEIQEAVGGKQFWKDDGTVEVARLASGEDVFVVSAPNANGEVAVLHMDGTPGFITIDDLAEEAITQSEYGDELTTGNDAMRKQGTVVMPLDEYLSLRVMTDRQNDEAARMQTERQQQVSGVSSQYQPGQQVNYQRGDKKMKGQVLDVNDPDTLIIQNSDGTIEYVPWEEVATWTGQNIVTQTDEEQEQTAAGLLEAADDSREQMAASIEAGIADGDAVTGDDGKTYIMRGLDKESIDLEKGTATFFLEDGDGNLIKMTLPFADFVQNGLKKGEDAARAEAERLAQEEAAIKQEKQRVEAEKAAREKAEKEAAEKAKEEREPDYLDKLLENNPEEFARVNDEENKDGGADTRDLFDKKIAELTAQVEEIGARRSASTSPSERRSLLEQANALRERVARMRAVIDSYNEGEGTGTPAPITPAPEPAPQAPSGGASPVMMTPQERKDAAKKEAQEKMGAAVAERVEKFMNSRKILGRKTMRPFGGKMRKAHYVLVEADAPIPSHDALNNFAPLGENSRDYGESQQKEVLRNAQKFSAEALHDMPTLRQDGLVPEGNGRTMMSQVAAANHDKGWDKDYLEALEYEADTYGFTPEDLASFEHPRVYIMFDEGEEIEMTARNMHQSNLDEKKGESKAQVAVRLAKLLNESPRAKEIILDEIYSQMEYDPTKTENGKAKIPQLTEVTKKPGVVASILKALVAAGAITESNIANYVNERDNTGNKAFSELVENILLGMAFDQESLNILLDYEYSNNEAIQRAIVRAAALMAARLTGYFGEDYDMAATLNNAVELLYRAAKFAEASKLPSNADAVEEYLKDTTALFDEGLTFDEETVALARLIWNTKRETNGRTLYETLGNLIDQIGRIVNSKENAGGMFADMEEINYESLQDLIKRTIFEKAGIKPLDNGQSAENAAPAGAQQQGSRVGEEDESGNEQPVQQGNVGGTVEAAPEEPAAEPAPAAEPEPVEAEAPASEPATDNLVDEDEIAALEKEIADRLRSQLNSGIDPGILVLAGRLAVAYIERGAAKIADFAKKMVSQFGDAIRNYIQDAYETARRTLRRNGKTDIVSQMDPEDVVDSFDVNNFDKTPAKQPKKKTTVESIFAETTGQEQPAAETSDADFGGLFAQPIDNQQNNSKNSRISEKEELSLRKEELEIVNTDYRTYITPQAREFFEKWAKDHGRDFEIPQLAFVSYASRDGVIIPREALEALPEIKEKEEQIKEIGERAKRETGSEYLLITPEEKQSYVDRLLSDENGSLAEDGSFSGPVARERKAFIVIGRPAGGKSSVFANPLSRDNKARIIDSDIVKHWLKGYNGGDGANYVNPASADVADEAMMQAMQLGENIVIPKVGGPSIINEVALPLRVAGYDVELCFNEIPPEASIMRAAARFVETGRYLSLKYLESIGDKPSKTFKKFAEKSIKESIDELSEKQIQELRRRLERLFGLESGTSGNRGEADGEGYSAVDGILQGTLGDGESGGSLGLDLQGKLFSSAEWRDNDVPYKTPPKLVWSSKDGTPVPGKEQVGQEGKQAQTAFRNRVRDELLKAVQTGERPYSGIVQLRKAAKEEGMDVSNEGYTDMLLQEIVEDALVRAARILNGEGLIDGKSARERYDTIVKLYEMQPSRSQRTSESIAKQQYSTPVPMGFLADMFAWKMGKTVLEPTAGTGMLVFAIPAAKVHVNEIDPTRLEILRSMGFAEVTDQDATEPFPAGRKYDAVIANPPFGSYGQEKAIDGRTFTKLEHIIALNALEAMTSDGKAVIIVGGNMEYNPNGSIKTDAKFYHYLYDAYNVKGVIDMDGQLYSRQGTTYPTRMILIDGKRDPWERLRNRVFAPVKENAPRKAETFADLYDIVDEINKSNAKTNGYVRTEGKQELPDNSNASGNAETGGRSAESRPVGDNVGAAGEGRTGRGGSTRANRGNESAGAERQGERSVERPVRSGVAADVAETQSGPDNGQDTSGEGDLFGANREGESGGNAGGSVSAEVLGTDAGVGSQRPQRVEEKRELESDKLHYVQHSGAFSLDSMAPAAMVEAMDASLKQIEEEYGPIDNFVRKELGYPSTAELYKALAAEQVDSVAMAIYQMKNGQAMIIGDQTGVGKGRQIAALIRWARRQGKKPIFVTQKAGLFSDMYRDLADVGSADLVPFIFNADGDMTYENSAGEMQTAYKHASDKLLKEAYEKGALPEGCDYAVLTYSQVSSGDAQSRAEAKKNGGKSSKAKNARPTPKADFLRKIAKDNYLLMDESHTAAGESNTGAYFQSLLKEAAGATFASATFAKRPDTMPLYALRTAMSQANVQSEELIASIKKGGVALQEIMSRALTQTGQMVRRERDMSDVETDWITIEDPDTVQRAKENYDKTIEAFNAIIDFQQNFVRPAIEVIAGGLAVTGSNATSKRGTEKLGIDNTPFASKIYNYTKQLMLALKADAIVDKTIEEIEAGRHPVIALESTMESGLKEEGYSVGDTVSDITFAASLLRGLSGVMRYSIKDSEGILKAATLTPEELGPTGEMEYYRLQDMIREFTAGVFASPLDLITMRLQDAGYRVGELTGRDLVVVRDGNDGYKIAKRDSSNKAKKKAAADFNSGRLDVLILNKAASTGISLHASKGFKDQRQRTMILAQPMSDINDYMQMIGRIDRTGQVFRGYYINLALPVAAEQRFNMMLSTKLKSLNANTAADQEGGGSVEAVDLLNKYGDQVVIEYLRDHPDIYEKLGDGALKTASTGGRYVLPSELDDYQPREDDARRITGRVALLNTQEQEEFYDDVIQRYNDLIQYLNDTGTNDLKITTLPLRAQTISRKVSSKGVNPDGDNPFAKNAYVESVEIDNLRKPMRADEVRATIEKLNGGIDEGPRRIRKLRDLVGEDQEKKTAAENERYNRALAKLQDDIKRFTDKVMARQGQSLDGKNKDIDDYVQEQTEKVEQKHRDNLVKIGGQAAGFQRKLEMFTVGSTYLVPDQLDNQMFVNSSPAIFCGFKVNEKKLTPSTTFAVFAVLDGRRKVEVKLSQPGPLETIKNHSQDNWGRTIQTSLENWDESIVNSARKKGFIMTGNILQAIADTQDEFGNFPGQLISYTDIDGNIHDGILMPDNWKPSQLRNSGVPINTKMDAIMRMEDFKSIDGKVEIISYRGPMIDLRVPKSKKEGEKYYKNEDLISLGTYRGGFHTYRGKMEISITGEENVRKALDILSNLGVRVADESEEEQQAEQQQTQNRYRFRDGNSGEDVRFRIREDEPPTKTGIGYKVFVLKGDKLYPPMVANPNGASTPTGLWLDADAAPVAGTTVTGRQQVKAGGKGTQGGSGTLSYRPGWHLGEIPYAIQFNRIDENGEKTLFPKNFVWAEVEYAADFDYQQEAMGYGMTKNGKFQHSLAGLPYLPKNGFYTYRTNPNPETDPWIITGAMRVKRLLTPSEVDAVVAAAGRQPQPRQAGAITDAQIEKLNEEIERRSQVDPEQMKNFIDDLATNLGVKVKVVRDVNEIKHENENVQRRKRRSKGYYDLKTGEIVLVLPNAESVADAEATIFHEGVGHEGMRGLFGDSFDRWLDDVYEGAEAGMKKRIDAKKQGNTLEDQREATEEYIAEMAERGVEDNLEMSFWERVKAKFRELVRALGIRLHFTDADIRYNLWKSKRRLAKKNETLLEKADRVATDQQLRRAAEASYEQASGDNGPDNTPGGGVRYRFIGEKGAANLDAAEENSIRAENLAVAKEMEKAGKKAIKIKQATGWERGADGKWRYEVPDNIKVNEEMFDKIVDDVEYNRNLDWEANQRKMFADPVASARWSELHEDYRGNLDEITKMANEWGLKPRPATYQFSEIFDAPELYKEYPELKDMPIRVLNIGGAVFGRSWGGEIDLYDGIFTPLQKENKYGTLLGVLVHELQHEIQKIEGFERGMSGTSSDYTTSGGEVEARNVSRRISMGTSARARTLASETEDVPRTEQTFASARGAAASNGSSESRVHPTNTQSSRVLRDRAITNDTQDVALRIYGNEVMLDRNIIREILVDQHTAVRTAMRAIEKESGKEATPKEDITKALNQLSSKQKAALDRYANGFLKPLMSTVAKVAEEMDIEFEDIIKYVSLRRALEANELYAKRDAKEYYQRKHDDAVAGIESRKDLDRAAKDRLIRRLDADLQNQLNDTERGMSEKYRELRGTDGKHEGKDYGATVSWFSDYVDMNGNRTDIVPPREPGEDNMSYQRRLKGMRKPVAGAETLAGAERLAEQFVHDFETRSGGLSRELWDKINAATGEILRIEYDSHLITKEQYDDIRNRSQYYVPLRGFADMTAEDAFSYVTDDLSDTFVPALMRAGGRISRPDSPFGFIAGMAASAINEGYKNMAVQALYRFIANRKDNSLAVISDSWYIPTGRMVTMADVLSGDARIEDLGKEVWEPAYPNIDPSLDMDAQRSVSDNFNSDMEARALLGQAAKGTAGLNLRRSFVFNRKSNEKQHFVRVKVLGEEKFIIFRGNPRAAQAINGILNPDTREISAYSRAVRATARTMAKLCTSYSVPFWFSNFFRDGQTAIANTFEREGEDYAKRMMDNLPFAIGVISAHVKGGNVSIKDNWSEAKKRRVLRLYEEYKKYAAGGAITGYSVIFNHAEYDKAFKRAIREKKSDLAETLSKAGDILETIGTVSEGIEQVFRFATFITSREEGRPMERCIDDAKNVTVNFNRKGSYAAMEWKDTANISTFNKKTGMYSTLGESGGIRAISERVFIWLLSQVAPWVRTRFMFVNPNIQGTYTTYSNWKISALRTASVIFGTAMTSFLIHLASELLVPDPDPDDRDKKNRRKIPYSHLTDYQRRSNIILPELGGVRVTMPLSQEYAPFWAIGDIMATAVLKEKYDQNTAWEIAKAAGEIIPVNVFEPTNLVPDPLAPALEAVTNTNYQGRNIFQKKYNDNTPDFKRAYSGTWEPLVDLSVALNRAMGGTNDLIPEGYGKLGNLPFRWNNPAAWQHIIEGMGGTTVSAFGDVLELAGQLIGPEDVKLGSVPIVNRFVKDPYEYGNDWYLNTEARKFKNLASDMDKRGKTLEKSGDMASLQRLYESDNWAIASLYNDQYKTEINRLEREIREYRNTQDIAGQQTLSNLQQELEILQEALVNDVKNLLKDRK